MTSSTGKLIIPIHILPNVSRIKSNQAIEFGQSIRRNFFLGNCKKNDGKLVTDPFSKNEN